MISTVTCGDKAVLRGRLSMPLVGTWWADLLLDTPTAPSGSVTIAAADGLSITGRVIDPVGVELEVGHVRVVGGVAGLWKEVSGSFRAAKLRDPLNAIIRATGETLSDTVSSTLLALQLSFWTLGKYPAHRAVRDLVRIASIRLGDDVSWRFLSDGKLWLGTETWTSATLPKADLVNQKFPSEKRTVLAVQTLSLLPGVDLASVGRVRAVDHWIHPDGLRTWACT